MTLPSLPFKERFTSGRQLLPGHRMNAYADMLTSYTGGIVATAAGTNLNSVQITSAFNDVSVVASANDSVLLPVAQIGLQICITNSDAADSLRVFPVGADTIKGAANFDMAAGVSTFFVCNKPGVWRTYNAA